MTVLQQLVQIANNLGYVNEDDARHEMQAAYHERIAESKNETRNIDGRDTHAVLVLIEDAKKGEKRKSKKDHAETMERVRISPTPSSRGEDPAPEPLSDLKDNEIPEMRKRMEKCWVSTSCSHSFGNPKNPNLTSDT
jgi:hypothetical protein